MMRMFAILLISGFYLVSFGQDYPFRDTGLGEDDRIKNLISLMNRDEKSISFLQYWIMILGMAELTCTTGMNLFSLSGSD